MNSIKTNLSAMEFERLKKFTCPYCNERISMLLDLSENGVQTYIEDCEICCQPIQIQFEIHDYKLIQFTSYAAQ